MLRNSSAILFASTQFDICKSNVHVCVWFIVRLLVVVVLGIGNDNDAQIIAIATNEVARKHGTQN